jgi:ribosomal protein L11 methylase PrmA
VKPGGLLLLSGILESQVADIKAAYQAGFYDFEVFTDELWALVVATKKP